MNNTWKIFDVHGTLLNEIADDSQFSEWWEGNYSGDEDDCTEFALVNFFTRQSKILVVEINRTVTVTAY